MFGFGMLAGLHGGRIEADLPTPWAGLEQRVSAYTYMIWLAVLAAGLLRTWDGGDGAHGSGH